MPQQTHSSYDTRPDIPDFLIVSSGALAIESEYSRYLSIDEGCWAWFLIDRERDLPYLAPGVEPEICGNDPGCFIAGSVSEVIAPLWIGLVLGGITPSVIAVAGWRRRLRRRKGFCATCGYNLTGLPEPRCPECGTAFSAGP
ncbi:MAG: hypothetical protein FLDDKLPJ_02763 [Phycisphaerae bacterium]|nr:hypothetical protein [Phycisphaerae bacterium]